MIVDGPTSIVRGSRKMELGSASVSGRGEPGVGHSGFVTRAAWKSPRIASSTDRYSPEGRGGCAPGPLIAREGTAYKSTPKTTARPPAADAATRTPPKRPRPKPQTV